MALTPEGSRLLPLAESVLRDLEDLDRAAGIPVVIGGFHVSGCLAMLPEMPDELQEALEEYQQSNKATGTTSLGELLKEQLDQNG